MKASSLAPTSSNGPDRFVLLSSHLFWLYGSQAASLGPLLCQEPCYLQSPGSYHSTAAVKQESIVMEINQETVEVKSITNRSRNPVLTTNNCCTNCPRPSWLVLFSMTLVIPSTNHARSYPPPSHILSMGCFHRTHLLVGLKWKWSCV